MSSAWREGLVLLCLAVLAFTLRCEAARSSLWLDELHTAWVVADDFSAVDLRARQGNATPVYFWLVWGITHGLGPSAATLRLLSIAVGTALVPGCYLLVRRWAGCMAPAVLTALLVALDADFLFFASEARPYALVQGLTLCQVFAFWQSYHAKQNSLWHGLASTLAALLIWVHVTAGWIVVAEFIFLSLTKRGRGLMRTVPFWLGVGLGTLVCLPLLPRLEELFARRGNWRQFVAPPSWLSLRRLFPWESYVGIPILVTLAGRLGIRSNESWRRRWGSSHLELWMACWLLVPILGAALTTHLDWARLFFRRYLMVASLAPPILSGLIIGLIPSTRRQWWAMLCVVAGCHVGTGYSAWHAGKWPVPDRSQDWAGAIARIATQAEHPWPVLLDAGLIETEEIAAYPSHRRRIWRDYLLFPLRSIYRSYVPDDWQIPINARSTQPLFEVEDLRLVRDKKEVWLLTARNGTRLPQLLVDQLQAPDCSWQVSEPHTFGTLYLYRLTQLRP